MTKAKTKTKPKTATRKRHNTAECLRNLWRDVGEFKDEFHNYKESTDAKLNMIKHDTTANTAALTIIKALMIVVAGGFITFTLAMVSAVLFAWWRILPIIAELQNGGGAQ